MTQTPRSSTGGAPAGPAIVAHGLTKTYPYHEQQPGLGGALRAFVHRETKHRLAVSDLDLEVPRGEVIALLGPNGAGKTTTIKMMCGLLHPTSGDLRVLGHEPSRRGFAFLSQISVLFGQKSMLWWDVPTHDSLLVHRQMYDLDKATFEASVAELVELLDVADIVHVPVRKLSLGQRMRCELVLALLHRPAVLFADEPTIGLDVVAKATLRQFLDRVNRELGTTIVLTSHDMDDIAALSRRVVLVNHGRKAFDGDLAGLTRLVRPTREVRATFARPIMVPGRVGDGITVREASPVSVVLDVPADRVGHAVQLVTGWGELTDVTVAEPDLDDVMATAFGAGDLSDDRFGEQR